MVICDIAVKNMTKIDGLNWWTISVCAMFVWAETDGMFIATGSKRIPWIIDLFFKKLFNKGIFLPIVYCLKWNRGSKRNIELLHFSGNCNNGRGMSLQSTTDHRSVLQIPKWTKKFFKKIFFFIAQLRGARTEDTCHLCKILQWDCTEENVTPRTTFDQSTNV